MIHLFARERARLRPGEFSARVGFNGVAQITPMVATLVVTPLLIHRLGADRFGIWSLALIAINTLASLDGGVSASLGRFFAVHSAHDDRAAAGRLLLGSLLFFAAFGTVLTLLAHALAPTLVGLVNVPKSLESEAVWLTTWLPLLATVALAADATTALLQGNGQFRECAIATTISSALFAVSVVVLVRPGPHLAALAAAAALRYVAMAACGLFLARHRLHLTRPLLPGWATVREVTRYSSRMQLATMTGFVNAELDGFVVAAVSPVRYVGLYSIGLQAASAARSVPLYAFSPLLTRLTTTFRRDGRDAAAEEFAALERRWLPSVFGFGVIALATVGFSVPVWLGRGYVLSGVTAVVLLTGYIVHVGLTGIRTCFVRAVGRPGLEARYSTVWTITNAALTIPLALLAGMIGVVGATAATGVLASVYFVVLCRREEGLPFVAVKRIWWLFAGAAVLVTVLGELVVLRTQLHGWAGLALTALPPALALTVFAPMQWRRSRSYEAEPQRATST